MNGTISVPIENLRIWSGANWVKSVENNSCLLLQIHFDQILIMSQDEVLESLNINGKLKGIYKDEILILIVSYSQQIRKIKFQIKENLVHCLNELSARFPVVSYGSMASKRKLKTKFRNVEEVFKKALEEKETKNYFVMPSKLKSFIKLCLMDPTFPQFVVETKEVIDKEILKNNMEPEK